MSRDNKTKPSPGSVNLDDPVPRDVEFIVEVYKRTNDITGWLAYKTSSLGILGRILHIFAKRVVEFTYNGMDKGLHEVSVCISEPKEINAVNEIFGHFGINVFYGDVLNKKKITIRWKLPGGMRTIINGVE